MPVILCTIVHSSVRKKAYMVVWNICDKYRSYGVTESLRFVRDSSSGVFSVIDGEVWARSFSHPQNVQTIHCTVFVIIQSLNTCFCVVFC